MLGNCIGRIKADWRRIDKKMVIVFAVFILLCGTFSSFVTYLLGGSGRIYYFINLPAWAPPRFIFPLVWTFMYLLIGGATGAVFCGRGGLCEADKYKGLLLFVIMMVFNIIWSPLFFAAYAFFLALLDIALMITLTVFIILLYKRVIFIAAAAMSFYLIWLVYSFILNFSIVLLN